MSSHGGCTFPLPPPRRDTTRHEESRRGIRCPLLAAVNTNARHRTRPTTTGHHGLPYWRPTHRHRSRCRTLSARVGRICSTVKILYTDRLERCACCTDLYPLKIGSLRIRIDPFLEAGQRVTVGQSQGLRPCRALFCG
jgi:hypothetical protein